MPFKQISLIGDSAGVGKVQMGDAIKRIPFAKLLLQKIGQLSLMLRLLIHNDSRVKVI